jgi:WD40 repeat protein
MAVALGEATAATNGNIYTGSSDRTVKVWVRNQCVRTLVGHTDMVSALCVSGRENELISGGYDRSIKVWDVSRGVCEAMLEGHKGFVLCLIMTKKGDLISSSSDKTIKVLAFRFFI